MIDQPEFLTLEDIYNYFESLANRIELIASFSSGENEDMVQGNGNEEMYPHFFLEQPFASVENRTYEEYQIVFKIIDRIEKGYPQIKLISKCKCIAAIACRVIELDKKFENPFNSISGINYLTTTESTDNDCVFVRVEFTIRVNRWVEGCSIDQYLK